MEGGTEVSNETRPLSQPAGAGTDISPNTADTNSPIVTKSNENDTKPPTVRFNEDSIAPTLADAFRPREEAARRIIAEDPEWNLAPVDRLTDICLKVIVRNFEKNPILKGIPLKYRDTVIDSISTELPLSIAAPLIPDEKYWQRRSRKRFKLGQLKDHGGSWKRMFFELHVAHMIEQHSPTSDEKGKEIFKSLIEEVKIASSFVEKLVVNQLKPMDTSIGPSTGDAPPSSHPTSVKPKLTHEKVPLDHVDLQTLLLHLKDLREFKAYYGMKDCGINFTWSYFGMTINDALKLAGVLKLTNTLKKLTVQSSSIDDDRCRLLCHGLLENTTLQHLDLSHNKIGDNGVRGIAKLLATPTVAISHINLTNNRIEREGADILGKALAQNSCLETLELRLNQLSDDGGAALFSALLRNKKLKSLNLSGNGLGSQTVSALCLLLRKNNPYLTQVDLSCNNLGTATAPDANNTNIHISSPDEGKTAGHIVFSKETGVFGGNGNDVDGDLSGKMIFEAISQNKYMTHMDLRMTDLSSEYLVAIQGILYENSGA